jgi:glycosyltransferase involved in cell wall biosynthesis
LDALVQALGTLLTDRRRARELGTAAFERAHREFTVQVMADRYEATYRRLLARRS